MINRDGDKGLIGRRGECSACAKSTANSAVLPMQTNSYDTPQQQEAAKG